jgi:hypothetical protein
VSKIRHIPPLHMVDFYASLGEKDRALEWLEKAYEERNRLLTFINTDPKYDSLRSDPRFADVLRRIGLRS